MRVLVCGGRAYADREGLFRVLDTLHALRSISMIIHGAYRGADTLAGEWATSRAVPVEPYPAQWDTQGPSAGPIRNQRMLDEGKPDLVLVAPGGRGTLDMVTRSKLAKVRIAYVQVILDSLSRR